MRYALSSSQLQVMPIVMQQEEGNMHTISFSFLSSGCSHASRWQVLVQLASINVDAFFGLAIQHITELLPMLYTPTGACDLAACWECMKSGVCLPPDLLRIMEQVPEELRQACAWARSA